MIIKLACPLVMVSGYGDSLETSSSLVQMAHQSPLQSALCVWVCKSNDTFIVLLYTVYIRHRKTSESKPHFGDGDGNVDDRNDMKTKCYSHVTSSNAFRRNICLPGNSPSWPHSIAVKSPFQNAELGSLLDVQRLENAVWRLWPREQRWGKFQHGVRLWNPLLYNFSLYGETYKIYVNL
jgi:hypothetical protein